MFYFEKLGKTPNRSGLVNDLNWEHFNFQFQISFVNHFFRQVRLVMNHVSKLQNDVTGRLVCHSTQLLDEGDVLLASANRNNAKSLVDDLDLRGLRVELVRVIIHLQLNLEAIAVPLDAKAILVYQLHSELFKVEIYFHFGNRVINLLSGRFYFFQSLLERLRHLRLKF